MGGKKGKNKGLTPSKRREAAKQSLQDRFKIETDIKTLVKTIESTDKERALIEKTKKELELWNNDRFKRRKETQAMFDTNNKDPRTKDISNILLQKDKLDLGEVRRRAILIRNCTAYMCKEKTKMEKKYNDWSMAFIDLLYKYKKTRDMLQLLQLHKSDKKDILQNRKEGLERQIQRLQVIYTDLSKLDRERQKHHNNITLEEYMDFKIFALRKKIDLYKEGIAWANNQIVHCKDFVTERRQKIQELKTTIKNKPYAPLEESKEYQRVCDENKKLLIKLKQLTRVKSSIEEETKIVRNEIAREEGNRANMSDDEVKLTLSMKEVQEQYKEKLCCQSIDKETTSELRRQLGSRDESLAQLQSKTATMEEMVLKEKKIITTIRDKINEVERDKRNMLNTISNQSYHIMQNTIIDYI